MLIQPSMFQPSNYCYSSKAPLSPMSIVFIQDRISLCSYWACPGTQGCGAGLHWTQRCASASWVLGFKVCATTAQPISILLLFPRACTLFHHVTDSTVFVGFCFNWTVYPEGVSMSLGDCESLCCSKSLWGCMQFLSQSPTDRIQDCCYKQYCGE